MIRLSGRLRASLIIGGQGIRARKLRTFLSMVSLFLGVLAVVVVQAGAEIANRAMLADIELSQGKDGTRQMYLSPEGQTVPVALEVLKGRTDAVAMTGTRAIIGEPGVKPINEGGAPIDQPGYGGPRMRCDETGCYPMDDGTTGAPQGQAVELQLVGLTGDIRQFRPFRPSQGQWLDFGGEPSLAPRLVLNEEAAKAFTRYHVPAEMRVDGATANPTPQIIGVVDDGGYQPAAYVRTDELMNWMPVSSVGDTSSGPGLQVLMTPAAVEVEHILRARLVAAGTPEDRIHVNTVQTLKQMSTELALMRWIFLGMAALVLLIGVAGILNVGLATVGERIEEFALRRAVGTPRLLLAGIVLAETLLTGLLTAGLAIGAGVVGLKLALMMFGSRFPSLEGVAFPWQAGVAGVIAGLVAGILGGLVPALRAARIPISTVMRA
ncbi:putative ABC transport system permease protein [Saccharothrix ecbatanensis]|uniref:Putative ABC transport system permease protein n=1 Tax=Saccharothrix ecbatanensis TaxID=1105145 RepID=A0A7W9HEG1_9PSEU|nr:ABC transporter permease [Saccharothrix ecbatanensis]MBB5800481.1 putative ABC transport system permease protein [Saccharothrix ecbatanensis]